MRYSRTKRCAFVFLCLAIEASALSAAEYSSVPRYDFEVGQRLTYSSDSSIKYDGGATENSSEWQFVVIGKNSDGSYRILITLTQIDPSKKSKSVQSGYANIDAEGSIQSLLDSFGTGLNPRTVIAKLPATQAEMKAGWQVGGNFGTTNLYKASGESNAEKFIFDFTCHGPEDEIYGIEEDGEVIFDRQKGVVQQLKTNTKQTYGINGQGTSETKLIKLENVDEVARAKLATDAERFFQAKKKFRDAHKDDATAEKLNHADDELAKIAATLESDEFRKLAQGLVDQWTPSRKNSLKSAAEKRALIGQLAYEFETTDLDGHPETLKGYRGKVVLLDFWYRGCGWCIRCMPQLKEVADHYRGEPVALLGMNTDPELEDAKFVVEKLGLNYPQLKAQDVSAKFKVHEFPILFLIDQQGKIREIHSGWTPTLRDDLIRQIDAMLMER